MCEIKKKILHKKRKFFGSFRYLLLLEKLILEKNFHGKKLSTHNLGKWYNKNLLTKKVAKKKLKYYFLKI